MTNIKTEEAVLSDINLNHESLLDGVKHLINWLMKQPHLPNFNDENLLSAFIVGSKSIERAKERLERYFSFRTKYPSLLSNRDATKLQKKKIQPMVFLPGLTPDRNTVIMLTVPKKEDLDDFSFEEFCKCFFMMLDLIYKNRPVTSGQIFILDCNGLSMQYVNKFVTTLTSAALHIYQNVFPSRIKYLLYFNASSTAELFCNKVIKMLLSDKLGQRLFMFKEDHKVLSKFFPADMLPSDYGGKSGSLEELFDEMLMSLKKENDWFMNEGSVGSDETKRPRDSKPLDQIHGTFRKLQID